MSPSLNISQVLSWSPNSKGFWAPIVGMGRRGLILVVMGLVAAEMVAGNVVLMGKNISIAFDDIEANFGSPIKASGECGVLYTAEPLNACTPLTNRIVPVSKSPFVLIIRGGCTFDEKVLNAQNAGFEAAIIYDNEYSATLIAMAGTSKGLHIHAVFVSKVSGETLKKYTGLADMDLWIIPSFEDSAWSIMAISFISLLTISAVLATCFFVRRHRVRREQPQASNVREFRGMSRRLVKAMPSLRFTSVLEDNCTSETCAVCLEDYCVGEKLRILPCRHKFHAYCVDSWLTSWRTFCPVCKRDARTNTGGLPASEATPLLSSAASTPFSSFHSSIPSSHAIQIPYTPGSHSSSRNHSISNSHRSYGNSITASFGRSSADHRKGPSNRMNTSSNSLGVPLPYSINSRHPTPFIPPSNGSPAFLVGSSSRQSFLRHYNEPGSPIHPMGSSSRHSFLRHYNESGSPIHPMGSSSRHSFLRNYAEPGSPSYPIESSSRHSSLRHCSESGGFLSAFASDMSLPGC